MELEIIVLVVLLVVGLGVFFLFRKKTLPAKTDTTPAVTSAPTSEGESKTHGIVSETPIPIVPVVEKEVTLEGALANTKARLWGRISGLWSGGKVNLEEIEEVLYTSDIGPQSVQRLLAAVDESLSRSEKKDADLVKTAIKNEMLSIFEKSQGLSSEHDLLADILKQTPSVLLIVGVNGAGKTTTIGKLSARLAKSGKKVLVAAGDTFRAAAGEQLRAWTERAQVEIFSPEGVTDPSAVAFDAVSMAKARGYDVTIIDTAGRLHTQQNLMEELKKVKRVIQKVDPSAPHEVLLVLDSNQGQNALIQAKEFHKALGVTGVILTKLDGTAKGGVAIGVACEIGVPIKMIGVGEKIGDLRNFSPREFVDSLI